MKQHEQHGAQGEMGREVELRPQSFHSVRLYCPLLESERISFQSGFQLSMKHIFTKKNAKKTNIKQQIPTF